nr:MAG TPA: hypothetical protein [Caudoviricetes sp.]
MPFSLLIIFSFLLAKSTKKCYNRYRNSLVVGYF